MLWIQITSGRGPEECGWVVRQILEQLQEESHTNGFTLEVLEKVAGSQPDSIKSVLCSLEGENVSQWIKQWEGSIQWIGKSPYRPRHKRSNWFAGLQSFSLPEKTTWTAKELKFETMRASGPGGQHVNKTETAVRVTHIPTGLSKKAQGERSQTMNRKLALARLAESLHQLDQDSNTEHNQTRWEQHNSLERGNPIRVYEGLNFKLKSHNLLSKDFYDSQR